MERQSINKAARIILEFIRQTETGHRGQMAYETIFRHKQGELPRPITQMTMSEFREEQKRFYRRFGSSASGAYQFMYKTLGGLIKELDIDMTEKFDADLQDQLAMVLLERRGYGAFLDGRISVTAFAKNLAKEWASFPVLRNTKGAHRRITRGQSYYAGDGLNKALVPAERIEAVLAQVMLAHKKASTIPIPEEAREVAADADKPMTTSKTWWGGGLSAAGVAASTATDFFTDLPMAVQLSLVGLAGVGFCAGIYVMIDRYRKKRLGQRALDAINKVEMGIGL